MSTILPSELWGELPAQNLRQWLPARVLSHGLPSRGPTCAVVEPDGPRSEPRRSGAHAVPQGAVAGSAGDPCGPGPVHHEK